MRIALFTETFLPKVDGIVTTLCYLLRHLEERGHDVLLFAPSGGPSSYAGARVIGVRAAPVPLYPELRIALPPPQLRIQRTLDDFEPELIHLVNPVALGLAGLRYARRREVPLVASYHTDLPGFARRWGLRGVGPVLWRYIRYCHRDAALNLTPSVETLMELDGRGIPNLAVWGRGVDTTRFSPDRRVTAWRERLSGGQPERPLLIHVGRLAPEKRVDWLIDVLEALPEARLAVVGDGPSRARLEARFVRRGLPAVFTGYLHGDELARAYAAGDVFVHTGANETLGVVVLEAMASGLAVVAPRSGGVLDHVADDVTGLLFAPHDRADLVRAVRRMLADPAAAATMAAAGRAHVQTLSWQAENDRLVERYRAVVDGLVAHDMRMSEAQSMRALEAV